MEKAKTFTDELRAIPPGESREWEMDAQQMLSKRQLVSRLNQMGASLSTTFDNGVFTVTNNAKA